MIIHVYTCIIIIIIYIYIIYIYIYIILCSDIWLCHISWEVGGLGQLMSTVHNECALYTLYMYI